MVKADVTSLVRIGSLDIRAKDLSAVVDIHKGTDVYSSKVWLRMHGLLLFTALLTLALLVYGLYQLNQRVMRLEAKKRQIASERLFVTDHHRTFRRDTGVGAREKDQVRGGLEARALNAIRHIDLANFGAGRLTQLPAELGNFGNIGKSPKRRSPPPPAP